MFLPIPRILLSVFIKALLPRHPVHPKHDLALVVKSKTVTWQASCVDEKVGPLVLKAQPRLCNLHKLLFSFIANEHLIKFILPVLAGRARFLSPPPPPICWQ